MGSRAWLLVALLGVVGLATKQRLAGTPDVDALVVAKPLAEPVVATPPALAPEPASEDVDEDFIEAAEIDSDPADGSELVVEKPLPEAGGNTVHGRFHELASGE